jgi:hypothetical protein
MHRGDDSFEKGMKIAHADIGSPQNQKRFMDLNPLVLDRVESG